MGHGDGVFPSPRPSWSVACEQRLRLRCPLSPPPCSPTSQETVAGRPGPRSCQAASPVRRAGHMPWPCPLTSPV